ncbi:MAG: FtsW/RodA/SpoVE family cell cycle protein [Sedimentisphaerales bacterium]|nr:FtsW/RodA/SpoVE family cell cycle protein [Sedimentisphaerales bacterium]
MYKFFQGRLFFTRLVLLAASAALLAIGIFAIYAVGHPAENSPASEAEQFSGFWKKQLVFAALGGLAFVAINLIRYRRLGEISYWLYSVVLLLLGILLLGKFIDIPFVPEINGTHRWIRFTIAGRELPGIQPSELCKLAYIIALCWYLRYRSNYRSFKALIGPFLLTLLPMVLIVLEPDLGTVMLMMPVLFVMLFVAGARVKHLLMIILLAILVSPLLWLFMQPYQRMRISSVFLQSPAIRQQAERHPKITEKILGTEFNQRLWDSRAGYHLNRSKLAITSGGPAGSGYRRGPFIKYDFLPYRINDFIFSVIAHQWGFAGAFTVILLFVIIIICGLEISNHNTDPFGRLLAMGITVTLTVEVIVNISMTLGLMPITGLTLPLVSYGGSSLLTSTLAIGLLNNIGRARPFSVAPKLFE